MHPGCLARDETEQGSAHFEQVFELGTRRKRHPRTALGEDPHELAAFEDAQRVSYRRATDIEGGCQINLLQPHSRCKSLVDDGSTDLIRDLKGKSRRQRFCPEGLGHAYRPGEQGTKIFRNDIVTAGISC